MCPDKECPTLSLSLSLALSLFPPKGHRRYCGLVCGPHNPSSRSAIWTPPMYMKLEKYVVLLISWECGYTPVSYMWCRRHQFTTPRMETSSSARKSEQVARSSNVFELYSGDAWFEFRLPHQISWPNLLCDFSQFVQGTDGTLHCTWPRLICFIPRPFSYSLSSGLSTLRGLCNVAYK